MAPTRHDSHLFEVERVHAWLLRIAEGCQGMTLIEQIDLNHNPFTATVGPELMELGHIKR